MSPGVWCSSCAGLGAVDAGRVRDLGLPSFEDPLPSVEAVVEPSGSKKAGSLLEPSSSKRTEGSMVQKFRLGPTLPMVPARIVRRVLRGDYVDMAELMEENLELELCRSTGSDEVKSIPLSKLIPVPDALTWARSFCLYLALLSVPTQVRLRICWLTWPLCWLGRRREIGGELTIAASVSSSLL